MAKYLKKFSNESEYNTYINGDNVYLPNVSLIGTTDVRYKPYDYSKDYLTFEILSDGYFCFKCDTPKSSDAKTIQYSKNGGEWTNLTSDINETIPTEITVVDDSSTYTYGGWDDNMEMCYWENDGGDCLYYDDMWYLDVGSIVYDSERNEYEVSTIQEGFIGTKINVISGDIIQFKGDNASYYIDTGEETSNYFTTTCSFNVCGNIMSLIDSTNFENLTQLTQPFALHTLFKQFTSLIDASNLSLPATTLTRSCYRGLLNKCSKLLYAPELPASQLVQDCYRYMFNTCSSLIYIKCLCDTNITNATYTQNWISSAKNTNGCKFVKKSTTQIYRDNNNGIPSNWVIENI